ncbi:UNVERIFIED_CONTAM: hypothetical protein Sradi_6121500 [Sesamum radiatum]|uniref:DUF7032 domain-containing protein n=1 Tax=Sesamum radiatum TaxID=300843 RepID=A0AAW2KLL1_SESRA
MHPATVPPPHPATAPPSSSEVLEEITQLLTHLLPATLSITCFASRWQVLRSKLASLKSLLSEISDSPHWSENPLLPPLLPALLSTLRRVETLCQHCSDASFSRGKLLMQSDLDMAAGWLSKQINDLELLLRSGVLHQSTAIVLSRPNPSSSKEELTFFIKDLFTRLQIGGLEFKRKGLESLIQLLSDDDKSAVLVAKEGNVSCLISLLDLNAHDSLRELAVHAVSLLVSSGDLPRKIVFEEGALGPLLRIIECSSAPVKEKAAMAVESITADPDNAWAISAYVEDIRVALAEESCPCFDTVARFWECIGPRKSGQLHNHSRFHDYRVLSGSTMFIIRIAELIKHGNIRLQHISASLLAKLSITDSNKIAVAGCMGSLLKLMESVKPDGMQEVATKALVSLLSVKANRKELVREEKNLMRLVQMLDPKNDVVSEKFPVAVVAAIMAGGARVVGRSSLQPVFAGICRDWQKWTWLELKRLCRDSRGIG